MEKPAMSRTAFLSLLACSACSLAVTAWAAAKPAETDVPRTTSGRPDLSGFYDTATITPLQRPVSFGDNLYLTPEQAREIEEAERYRRANDPTERGGADRGAPPVGGDGSEGSAGNVGGYNTFWVDPGDEVFMIDGKFRTSIIIDPPNGRMPPLTEEAKARAARRAPPARTREPPTGSTRATARDPTTTWSSDRSPSAASWASDRQRDRRCSRFSTTIRSGSSRPRPTS
jgi:hypothetical protein